MENVEFNKYKIIKYWVGSSDDDFETMVAMFDSKRYSWSLFVGHSGFFSSLDGTA